MKSKEEIEQLASKRFTIKQFIGEDDYNRNETIAARCGYVEGYTQCQEDMSKILFNILKLVNEPEYTEHIRLADINDYIKSLNKQD